MTITGLWLIALWPCSIHAMNLVFGCRLLPILRVFPLMISVKESYVMRRYVRGMYFWAYIDKWMLRVLEISC